VRKHAKSGQPGGSIPKLSQDSSTKVIWFGRKFSSNWEEPFRIADTAAGRAYYLQHLSGKDIWRTWNATHLKFYYS